MYNKNREFTKDGTKYKIVDRFTNKQEITVDNPKYDIMAFDTDLNAWVRVNSCMTIESGKNYEANYKADYEGGL